MVKDGRACKATHANRGSIVPVRGVLALYPTPELTLGDWQLPLVTREFWTCMREYHAMYHACHAIHDRLRDGRCNPLAPCRPFRTVLRWVGQKS